MLTVSAIICFTVRCARNVLASDEGSERKALLNLLRRPIRLRLNLTKNIRGGREAMNYSHCCTAFFISIPLCNSGSNYPCFYSVQNVQFGFDFQFYKSIYL